MTKDADGTQAASNGEAPDSSAATSIPNKSKHGNDLRARQEKLLDEGVQETFPASDPVSVAIVSR